MESPVLPSSKKFCQLLMASARHPRIATTRTKGAKAPLDLSGAFFTTQACKPGSVLTAIYLAPGLPAGSSRLLGTAGPADCPSMALLRDRVYSVKPMLPWAGWALTPPFHPYSGFFKGKAQAVSLCCTCPGVTPGGRYPLSLPCGARTFLTPSLSAPARGCPAWSRKYCTPRKANCQMSCKIF